ncbi:Fpg/Nei family DNA glycosylase [Georgenia thermotolerans]|uniref:DNA-(apurinic or apyrimidinic site) lyase n=1 Tax=Georgenia thermotolerans TaxID=527326 RepID=A0A7J5USR1_9MICO|nr:DNA-formamidopyrimidine glycosylase family protein [Georgenia thermotolerans]KAE8765310.1 Fpg/Nei family DNA glycosylase [Georgenia thermotolerans]
MPEGHTIHRLARDMAELVGTRVTATSPQGRVAAETVNGATVLDVDAVGKHLLVDTSGKRTVHVHLGMRGKWLRFSPVTGEPMRQVRLRLAADGVAWDLIAPSTCELLGPRERDALVGRLGPDPLRADADPAEARRRIVAFRGPIGAALLDQGVVAGVGNVFRAEALHACRIAPTRRAGDLSEAELEALWSTLARMMALAVEEGRIITVDDEDRLAVPEDRARRVYKQRSCYDCGTPIQTAEIGGRTSYSCPRCQAR